MTIARWKRQFDAGFLFLDTARDLDELTSNGLKGRATPDRTFRHRAAQRMQQPIGTHVQEQAELVGLPS